MDKLQRLKDFLKANYNGWQAFLCESQFDTNDFKIEVYNNDNIQVYECGDYGYVDIVGISTEDATAIGIVDCDDLCL